MKAYSQDLRQRVLRAVDQGTTQAEIAKTFALSTATIKHYLRQRRETGQVVPKAILNKTSKHKREMSARREHGLSAPITPLYLGRPARKGAVLQANLREQLESHPDATREEHCQLFEAKTGLRVSPASISRARASLGWTRKKRRS